MRQLRRYAERDSERAPFQDEKHAQDRKEAGKAVWRSLMQQVHEAGNYRQGKAIKYKNSLTKIKFKKHESD